MSHPKLFSRCVRTAQFALVLASSLACAQSANVSVAGRLGIRRATELNTSVSHLRARTEAPADLSLNFGLIDFPRSPDSTANGLNKHGDVVGFYGPNLPQWEGTEQSYLLHGNSFQELKYPGAAYTGVLGLNDTRAIVGWYEVGDGMYHAYLRQGLTYTNIDDPAFQNSIATNINDDGEIIGETFDNTGNIHGFILLKGTYTTIDPPNSTYTEPLGINSTGVIVGNFEDQNLITHGFVLHNSRYTIVDYPGATNSDLTGINDKGQMIGGYGDDVIIGGEDWPTPNAFLLQKGVFTPITLPFGDVQVTWTYTFKGNDFVGLYVDSLGNIYGYQAQIGGALAEQKIFQPAIDRGKQ